MKKLLLILILASSLAACQNKKPELKSPCVSVDNGIAQDPCGPRVAINQDIG
jgi:hypothetical protein